MHLIDSGLKDAHRVRRHFIKDTEDNGLSANSEQFDSIVEQLRQLIDKSVSSKIRKQVAIADAALKLTALDLSELILGARQIRNRQFGNRLFGEPAWDILLQLHVAYHRDQAISISAAVTFGDTPPTTGLRWLSLLEREGLVERCDDPFDNRRQFVALTSETAAKMDEYVTVFGDWAATKAILRKL